MRPLAYLVSITSPIFPCQPEYPPERSVGFPALGYADKSGQNASYSKKTEVRGAEPPQSRGLVSLCRAGPSSHGRDAGEGEKERRRQAGACEPIAVEQIPAFAAVEANIGEDRVLLS